MVKIKTSFILFTALLLLAIGCDNREIPMDKYDNFARISTTTSSFSNIFLNAGVSEIITDGTVFKFKTFKHFILNGEDTNFEDFQFTYKDNILRIEGKPSLEIYSIDNKYYINTKSYKGILNALPQTEIVKNQKLAVMLMFFAELVNVESNKINAEAYLKRQSISTPQNTPFLQEKMIDAGPGCSFWNTKYSVGIGLNKSAAMANFQYHYANDISTGQVGGCTRIGAPESDSFSNVYYVTQAWCC